MTINCPACGKPNEVVAASACSRCGCDLSVLRQILAAALADLNQAKQRLREADWFAALAHAEQSWKMVHTPQSARLACLAAAAIGDGERLARWRPRLRDLSE